MESVGNGGKVLSPGGEGMLSWCVVSSELERSSLSIIISGVLVFNGALTTSFSSSV